jgi:hypothetical protein
VVALDHEEQNGEKGIDYVEGLDLGSERCWHAIKQIETDPLSSRNRRWTPAIIGRRTKTMPSQSDFGTEKMRTGKIREKSAIVRAKAIKRNNQLVGAGARHYRYGREFVLAANRFSNFARWTTALICVPLPISSFSSKARTLNSILQP